MTRPAYGRVSDVTNTPTEILASTRGLEKMGVQLDNKTGVTLASLTTALTGLNNDLVFTAVEGMGADNIQIKYTDPGGVTATLSVTVTGTLIDVSLGRAASAINTTATALKAAVEGNATAASLVTIANAGGNDGSGLVTALSATNLSGGVEVNLKKGLVMGKVTASGLFAPYDNTASDGTEVAVGILADYWYVQGTNQDDLPLAGVIYRHGSFNTASLISLDSGALTDLGARQIGQITTF